MPRSKVVHGMIAMDDVSDTNQIWRMLFSEFLGTAILLFLGCGSIMWLDGVTSSAVIQISLTFGFTIATLVQIFGQSSGCHINPAVTVSFLITGQCSFVKSALYIVAQCVGAIAGIYLLQFVTPNAITKGLGKTAINSALEPGQGFIVEAFITFVLILVIHSVCDEASRSNVVTPALSIGLTIAAAHLAAIKFTGASMNPARSLGPAVALGFWTNHWVYWAGPIFGGLLGGIVHNFVLKRHTEETANHTIILSEF
ncbi:Aquaporin-like,Major intrinsic protein,Major intrinsic protein, conserved site [Cinara cedri]|uniref:Aquaporin-like,Major intrinsic protein,Major intrinsic protein, conserved site n=1 Tax=Cinara cedri TaxID=506608 RepID=A0A5E4MR76_9HEMI|nr:Aquaporin-like,Major intrinsic protein,Major intrinsic protein, conserved site [Cinara cedri]